MNSVQRIFLIRTAILIVLVSAISAVISHIVMSHEDALKNQAILAVIGSIALFLGWLWVVRPMSKMIHEHAEEEAKARERGFRQRFHAMVQNMEEGVVIQNGKGVIIEYNAAALRILGLTENQIRGKDSYDPQWRSLREDGSDCKGSDHPSSIALRTGMAASMTMGVRRPNGDLRWLRTHASPFFDQDPTRPAGVVITFQDITEERNSNERLELAIHSMGLGVWDWRVSENRLTWDDSMYRLFGQPKDKFGGTFEAFERSVHREDLDRLKRELAECFNNRKDFSSEFRIVHPDGSIRRIRAESRGTYAADGTVLRHVGVNWDVTDQREQELKILTTSRMASLGEMSAGVAHEINNPLAIIVGKTETLLNLTKAEGTKVTDLERHLKTIEKTTSRIATIVRGLRTFSREGHQDPFESVSVHDLLNDTLELCRNRFLNNGIELEVVSVPPEERLECRPTQVSQVILNLLNNAFDAVHGREAPWVRLEVLCYADEVEFAVSDCGTGIPPELRDKLMQPFFTTKEAGKGTGLGLSISVGIAESHKGRLEIDDRARNTTFILRLPRTQSVLKAAA